MRLCLISDWLVKHSRSSMLVAIEPVFMPIVRNPTADQRFDRFRLVIRRHVPSLIDCEDAQTAAAFPLTTLIATSSTYFAFPMVPLLQRLVLEPGLALPRLLVEQTQLARSVTTAGVSIFVTLTLRSQRLVRTQQYRCSR